MDETRPRYRRRQIAATGEYRPVRPLGEPGRDLAARGAGQHDRVGEGRRCGSGAPRAGGGSELRGRLARHPRGLWRRVSAASGERGGRWSRASSKGRRRMLRSRGARLPREGGGCLGRASASAKGRRRMLRSRGVRLPREGGGCFDRGECGASNRRRRMLRSRGARLPREGGGCFDRWECGASNRRRRAFRRGASAAGRAAARCGPEAAWAVFGAGRVEDRPTWSRQPIAGEVPGKADLFSANAVTHRSSTTRAI